MKTFKNFVGEEIGTTTGTGGGSNIGNEPPTIGPTGKHPHSDLVRRQNKLRQRGVVVPEAKVPAVPVTPPAFMTKEQSELFEDPVPEQRKRDAEDKSIPGTEFATSDKNERKNSPFSPERKSEIKKMTKSIEEEKERDVTGKLKTSAGGYWDKDPKTGKLMYTPRKELPSGWKKLPGTGTPKPPSEKIDRSKFVRASEHPDIIAAQKKKIEDAEAKKKEKEVKDRVQNLKLLRQLEKIQKERSTLHQTLMKKK